MPKVFNIMQYCKHPITGEVLITEEQIKSLFDRKEDVQTSEEKAKNWVWTPGK